jgi:hypothetical protein
MALINIYAALFACWITTGTGNGHFLFPPVGAEAAETEAVVVGVAAVGKPNAYTFDVTLKSPDTGCDQYADWWEVVGMDGRLIYRRVLGHSHVQEQPFTRSGGPVAISPSEEIYIRGHMNKAGYGTNVFRGTVAGGFGPATLAPGFAINLEEMEPLPPGCAF